MTKVGDEYNEYGKNIFDEEVIDKIRVIALVADINAKLPNRLRVAHDGTKNKAEIPVVYLHLELYNEPHEWAVVFFHKNDKAILNRQDSRICIRALRKVTKKDWYIDSISNYVIHYGEKDIENIGTNDHGGLEDYPAMRDWIVTKAKAEDPEFWQERAEEITWKMMNEDARQTEDRSYSDLRSTYKRWKAKWKKQRTISSFQERK